jgi:hypothetical protein
LRFTNRLWRRLRSFFSRAKTLDPTENLHSLHQHEEMLRGMSLDTVKADATLSEHWALVSEAMNVIYAFVNDHPHHSDGITDQKCLQQTSATKSALNGHQKCTAVTSALCHSDQVQRNHSAAPQWRVWYVSTTASRSVLTSMLPERSPDERVHEQVKY